MSNSKLQISNASALLVSTGPATAVAPSAAQGESSTAVDRNDFAGALAASQESRPARPALTQVAADDGRVAAEPIDTELAAALDALAALLSGAPVPAETPAPVAVPADVADAVDGDSKKPALADPQNAYALAALGLLPPSDTPAAAPAPAVPQVLDLSRLQLQAAPAPATAGDAAAAEAVQNPLPQLDEGAQALIERIGQSLVKPVAEQDDGGSLPAADDTAAPQGLPLPAAPRLAAASADLPAAAPLELKGEPRQWQQPLLQALGDRLQLQIAARSEQATIKLSPPMLGQVEIAIRQQGGELQVRLAASHGEVARQLQAGSEGLRQELVQRHSGEVSVQVTASSRDVDTRGGQAGQNGQAGQSGQSGQNGREGLGGGQSGGQSSSEQQRRPGRALSEAEPEAGTLFAAALNTKEQVLQ